MVSLQAAIAVLALSGAGQTVLLDFYADWCGPCKAMNSTVHELAAAGYPVKRINIDQNRALATQFRVQSIPCFVMLVDGQEVDRVTGGTTYYRLEQMCKRGAATPSAPLAPSALAVLPSAPLSIPPSVVPVQAIQPVANQPLSPSAGMGSAVSNAGLLAASVRLRVEDPNGHSCGSGTIIDARGGQALILTCGHIFRDSQGNGQIDIDLFGPNGPQRVQGELYSFDLTRDIGLVRIRDVPGVLPTARIAPPGYNVQRGMPVVSVGCNNGEAPTARHSQINSLDKFLGPPNLQVGGQPVEGRSGGGLFSGEGYLIGVCNAADPSDKEGLFAALGSIYAELDRAELAFVYKSPGQNPAVAAAPSAPQQTPGPADLASLDSASSPAAAPATGLPPHEQAALDEIRRRKKEGAKIIFIVCSRDNPNAKSEIFELNNASPAFQKQLADEVRPQQKVYQETSLELPKPRKILLEWSAEK